MDKSPIYIYVDHLTIEVHKEMAYHQTEDGRHFVELSEPIRLFSLEQLETLVDLLWPRFDPKSDGSQATVDD